jgi:hypothetical protein
MLQTYQEWKHHQFSNTNFVLKFCHHVTNNDVTEINFFAQSYQLTILVYYVLMATRLTLSPVNMILTMDSLHQILSFYNSST